MANLTWSEPAAVHQAKRALLGPKKSAAYYKGLAGVIFGLIFAPWLYRYLAHGKGTFAGLIVVAGVISPLLSAAIYLINERTGADVMVTENGVGTKHMQGLAMIGQGWQWPDLDRCALLRANIDDTEHSMLVLRGKEGRYYPIGLGKMDPDKLQTWFQENGHILELKLEVPVVKLETIMEDMLPPPQQINLQAS